MSSSRSRIGFLILVAFVVGAFNVGSSSNAKDEKGKDGAESDKPNLKKTVVQAFMHRKLTAAQDIMEGLALEDFEKIEKGARQLKAMTVAADFMVYDDQDYRDHAKAFGRAVTRLENAAEKSKLEGSTLAFMEVTMNCVECHKHVRGREEGKK